ncbi:hypothetical protein Tco_0756833 [Tanacetum coccineum]
MLESKAYQTYYAFSFGEKAPKPKYIRKKADSDTSPKKKPIQATKGTRLKSKAKVDKPNKKKQPAKKTKAKGDGVDTQSKVPDEQQQKTSGTDEGTGTIPGVPDVPLYEFESGQESWGDSEDEDDQDDDVDNDDDSESDDHDDDNQTEYEEEDVDDRVRTPLDYELTDEEKLDDEETMDDEEDDEDINELYDNADEPVQSSSASFDFTSKLLNLKNPSPAENEIASLLETSTHHATAIPEITSDFTTTTPTLTMFFNPLITGCGVSALESEMSELRQTNQFVEAVSLIQGIVDTYLVSKMKEAVDVSPSSWPKIEKYVTKSLGAKVLVRSTNQPQTSYVVEASLSEFELKKILINKIEANKSINRSDNQNNLYNALVKSYNYKDIITSYDDVVLLKRGQDDQDKDKDPFVGSDRGTKRRKSGKDVESSKDSRSKENKSSSTSKDTSQSQHKSSGKSAHVKEPSHIVENSVMQKDQVFVTGDDDEQPANKEVDAESRDVHWWKDIRERSQASGKDNMTLSYSVSTHFRTTTLSSGIDLRLDPSGSGLDHGNMTESLEIHLLLTISIADHHNELQSLPGLCQSSRSVVALEHSTRWYSNSVILLQVPLSRSEEVRSQLVISYSNQDQELEDARVS